MSEEIAQTPWLPQDGLWFLADRHGRPAGDGRTCGGSDAAGGRVSWPEPGRGSGIQELALSFGSSKGYTISARQLSLLGVGSLYLPSGVIKHGVLENGP